MYNKVPGDGREFVVTNASAIAIRSEDGRYVSGAFLSDLFVLIFCAPFIKTFNSCKLVTLNTHRKHSLYGRPKINIFSIKILKYPKMIFLKLQALTYPHLLTTSLPFLELIHDPSVQSQPQVPLVWQQM